MGDSLMAAVFDAKLDKLERNRISAQKCRAKRKRLCRETEHRVNELSAENANLLENQRLKILLANAGIQVDTTDPVAFQNPVTFQAQQSRPKRIKYESGITHSYGSSESADGFLSTGYNDHHSVLHNCSNAETNVANPCASPSESTYQNSSSSDVSTELIHNFTIPEDLILEELSDFLSSDSEPL